MLHRVNKQDEQVETLNGNLNPWKVSSERSEAVCERRVMYLTEKREDGLLRRARMTCFWILYVRHVLRMRQ